MHRVFKDIDDMTVTDIQEKLNSSSFISSNTRQTLTNRLNFLLENDISDRFRTLSKKKEVIEKKVQSKHIDDTMFPIFMTGPNKSKSNLDFTKFAKNGEDCSRELIDKNINIGYNDVLEIYDKFAFLRIKLYHNELSNKIRLLHIIKLLKHHDTERFYDHFGYDKLVRREEKIRDCISICEKMIFVRTYIKKIEELYMKLSNEEIFKSVIDNRDFISQVTYSLSDYETHVTTMQSIEDILDILIQRLIEQNMSSNQEDRERYYTNSKELIQKILMDSQHILKNIITCNDPHIVCEYYVSLHYNNQSSNYLISALGASTNYYVNFDDEFMSHRLEMQDRYLRSITVDQLEKIFKEKYDSKWEDFFVVYDGNKKIHMNCMINDRDSIKTGTFDIINISKDISVFSSMISNDDKQNDQSFLPRNNKKYISNWHQRESGLECSNKQFIDTIFDQLSELDKHGIMRPQIKNSFRVLASKTSREMHAI
jgi:hypothetical protein